LRELDLNQRPSGYEPIRADLQKHNEISFLCDKPLISRIIQPTIRQHSRALACNTGAKRALAG
jgi:hypothetical protein